MLTIHRINLQRLDQTLRHYFFTIFINTLFFALKTGMVRICSAHTGQWDDTKSSTRKPWTRRTCNWWEHCRGHSMEWRRAAHPPGVAVPSVNSWSECPAINNDTLHSFFPDIMSPTTTLYIPLSNVLKLKNNDTLQFFPRHHATNNDTLYTPL